MGNRILKESIRMNPRISQLSFFEESLFYRLMVTVDDYGVFPAHPLMLAHVLFPMREDVTRAQVEEALSRLEALGLICRYAGPDGEEYLKISGWERHQRLRNSIHRFPMPEDGASLNAPATPETEGALSGPESIETTEAALPEEKPAARGRKSASAEKKGRPAKASPAPGSAASEEAYVPPASGEEQALPEKADVKELPIIELPLNDQSLYPVTREDVASYQELYPAVDVIQALRNMKGWCVSNPTRRKTRSGIPKFINGWLAREQNRGGIPAGASPDNPYSAFIQGGAT